MDRGLLQFAKSIRPILLADDLTANGRCRVHKGSPVFVGGIGNVNFKHGKYSTSLPSRIAARYEEARRDPNLLALDEELAMIDARLRDLGERSESQDSAKMWEELWGLRRQFLAARRKHQVDMMQTTVDTVMDVIHRGRTDHANWNEISRLIALRARVVSQERKRREAIQAMVSAEEVATLMATILAVIKETVSNPAEIAKIGVELGRLSTLEPESSAHRGSRRRRR